MRIVGILCHAAALEEVCKNPLEAVSAGLRGRPGWSAAQYKTVVQCVVQAPHGAVVADELYTRLAESAVVAMVNANLLSYRPPSGVWRLHKLAGIYSQSLFQKVPAIPEC